MRTCTPGPVRAPTTAASTVALLALVGGCPAEPPPPVPVAPVEWPNEASRANSDRWLVEHHDEIDVLRPRILVLNFVNGDTQQQAQDLADRIIAALVESSRPRGYDDADAPPALEPEVLAVVDLRDDDAPGAQRLNSAYYPREEPVEGMWGFDYEALFTAAFAAQMNLLDPDHPDDGALDLCTAIDRGLVHEVWVYGDGDHPDVSAAEILENKPVYDAAGNATGAMNRCAGNGCFDEEDDIPCARTVRIGWVNSTRGPGCFLESLGHGVESIGAWNEDVVPQLSRDFIPFANYRLDERYGLPVDSWYACPYDRPCLAYPTTTSVAYVLDGASGEIDDYDAVCGNVHWPPNGRTQYDLLNTAPVLTSCAHYGDGTGAKEEFTNAAFAPYRELAPDCMGPFLVWWRQNWPGPHTSKVAADGTPMTSWWPYLYY